MNASAPSTVRSFRWSRLAQPSRLSRLGGFATRTSPPAARSGAQKPRPTSRSEPNQS